MEANNHNPESLAHQLKNSDNPNHILEKILDEICVYYESKHITFPKKPKITKYTGEEHIDSGVLMKAMVDPITNLEYYEFFTSYIDEPLWQDLFELNPSHEALSEFTLAKMTYANNKVISKITTNTDANIIYFSKAMPENLSDLEIKALLAHELWHVIENNHGLMNNNTIITEGTATFSQARYLKSKIVMKPSEHKEFFALFYFGSAYVVQEYVKEHNFEISIMLDPDHRSKMNIALQKEVGQIAYIPYKNTILSEKQKKEYAIFLKEEPEFQDLNGNLSPEIILSYFNRIGATKLVKEIKDKNLDKLMDYYKSLGI